MLKADFLIFNSQVLTCASSGKPKKGNQMREIGLISDGAVALKDEKIIAVGKSNELLKSIRAQEELDAQGKVMSPGFIECHTHLVFAGNRIDEFEMKINGTSYTEIMASGGGILTTVRQTRAASFDELLASAGKRLSKLLTFGVTTCEIKTGYGLETDSEMRMLEVIIELSKAHKVEILPTFMPAHAIPPEFSQKPNDYVSLICEEMLPKAAEYLRKQTQKPFFADVFCEKNAFGLAQSEKILKRAKQLGFRLKAHVDEFNNLGGAKMAISLSATSIDHLDKTKEEEIALLAKSSTIGVITPAVNFNLGSTEFANARKMIDSGCALAISTDYNPGSSPCYSMPLAMAIACRYQKLLPSEAFNAATINAAFALDLAENVGSIEVGKQADLVLFDTRDYREIVYEFGSNPVEKVFKKGRIAIG